MENQNSNRRFWEGAKNSLAIYAWLFHSTHYHKLFFKTAYAWISIFSPKSTHSPTAIPQLASNFFFFFKEPGVGHICVLSCLEEVPRLEAVV